MSRSIVDTLRHLNAGVFIDDVSGALSEVVKAVDTTGKAGSITIKINLRRATAGAMAVRGEFTMKRPAEAPIEALLFPTPEGNLLTEDPSQKKLDLRPIEAPALQIKTVNG